MFSCVLQSYFKAGSPDIVLVSSPTFFSMFSASFYALSKRAKLILDIRDLWPAAIVELGVLKNKLIIDTLEFFEKSFYKQATKIVVVTKAFKENLVDRGIHSDKIEVITNGVDINVFKYNEEARMKLRSKLNIQKNEFVGLYIGAHGISQSLNTLLEVAVELPTIKFLFVGEGAEKKKLIKIMEDRNLENIIFIEGQPKHLISNYYSVSDVCFVPLRNIEIFKTFIPSKIFEIMSNSRPIIASLEGESKEILEESGSAIITKPENVQEIKEAILYLKNNSEVIDELGENGRRFVIKKYTRKSLASKYLNLLEAEVK